MKTKAILTALGLVLGAAVALPARAQEVLPRPAQPFGGKIGRTTKNFPKEVTAPKGAPNVLLILTDDVGFGASSTFGGPKKVTIDLTPGNLAVADEQKLKQAHAAIAVPQ